MGLQQIDVRRLIEDRPFGRYQMFVTAMCALIVFFDGFDTQAIGYVAPAVVQSLHVTRQALGPVFSAGLVGLMVGALIGGPVSDRFGRKPVLLGGMVWFSLMSLLTAQAQSIDSLLVLRFLTGLGLGCVMPNAIALTSEFAPDRARATAVMVMFCGFSLGAALGGLMSAVLIRDFGWQAVFVAGGVLPLLVAFAAWRYLPESPRFLLVRNASRDRILAIARKLDPRIEDNAVFTTGEPEHKTPKSSVRMLFAERRGALTLLLWIIFFMSLLDLYFLSSWLPTLIHDTGLAVDSAALITAMLQVGGTVGTLTLGRIFDRAPPFRALAVVYLLAAVFIGLVGLSGASVFALVASIFGAGFCVVGGQIGANALAARAYPTAIRGTGVGWALGVGRAGSVLGPIIGGVLLSVHWETRSLFMLAAVPVLVASLAALAISRSMRHANRGAQAASNALARES
jgi:AAHS family 4-hydroxybenzoate transporter-like MFS transporter